MSIHNTGKKWSVIRDSLGLTAGGIYCFTPYNQLDSNHKMVFKIGLAHKYIHRIESYHSYYSNGVYIVAALAKPPCPNGRTKNSMYLEIENFIFDYLVNNGAKRVYSTTRVKKTNEDLEGATEFFYCTQGLIHRAFRKAYNVYGGEEHLFYLDDINADAVIDESKKPNYIGHIVYHF